MKKIVEQSSESKVGEEKTLPVFHAKNQKKQSENLIKENQIVIDELLNDENTQMGEEKKVSPKVVEKSSKKEQAVLDGDKNQNADVAKDFDNQDESTANFESQQLSESTQVVARQKSKKKKILTFIFFIINLVVIAYIIIRQAMSGELSSIGKIMGEGNFKWGFFFLAVGVWGVMAFLDSVKTSRLIKQSSDRFRPFLAYKLNAIGRYYDNITPMATGGQPFQVYYLTNRGMSGGSALSVAISKYCLEQISSLIVCATAIIIAIVHFTSLNIISVASYVGFALNFTVFFVIFLVSVNQKIGKILIAKVFKLLYKLKIIKNYEKQYESVMRTVNNFQSTMKKFAKNIKELLFLIGVDVFRLILNHFINVCIFLMFGGVLTGENALKLMVFNVLIALASSFMPLPGGTGVAEISFPALFRDVFPAGTVGWAMLLSRLFSYYAYLLQGVSILVYDYVIGNKRYEWQKRKWELEDESSKFKADQLKKYKNRSKKKSAV